MYTKEEIATKLATLCSALNDCDIPAEILFDEETGDPILFAALWNCEDGSAVRLEVCEDVGCAEGEILVCANPMHIDYEDFVTEDEDEDEE